MKTYVIFGDCDLTLNIDCLFPQVMHVFHRVNKWHDKVKTWFQLFMKLSKSVEHDSVLLWNNNHKSKEVSIWFTYSL